MTVPSQSHSSSTESLSWRQSTYSRTSSDDSLYLPLENDRSNSRRPFPGRKASEDSLNVLVNNRQTIRRWNGISREAINWNSLPRDPELFFPTGNCLVYLYPAGHSQRGPSFRIPYHVLLYSGCQPLVQQCLVSTLNISSPDRNIAKRLSSGTADYAMSDETRTYLYLYPPAGLSRDESYSYHITTRNFFAWLLGVPLVGTDPVSALLDLKARMDIWRDPNANNFDAIFEYARQQAYGGFEEIQVEMDEQIASEGRLEKASTHTSAQTQHRHGQYRHETSMVQRSDSLKQRSRSTIARTTKSHIALQDKRVNQAPVPAERRQLRPTLTTLPTMPAGSSTVVVDRPIRQVTGPARSQSASLPSSVQRKKMTDVQRYVSRSSSISPVSPITPADSNGVEAALQCLIGPSSTESIVPGSNSQAAKTDKKKRRVSWADNNLTAAEARSSQTDLTYPNMQGFGLQSAQASSSAINAGQLSPVTRRSLSPVSLSSTLLAGPSQSLSMPLAPTILPSGEYARATRPGRTMSLISISNIGQASTPAKLQPCSGCGKIRRPDGDFSQRQQASTVANHKRCSCCAQARRPLSDSSQLRYGQSRPAAVVEPGARYGKTGRPEMGTYQSHKELPRPMSGHSMKSFRSNKSWRSFHSIRSSVSLRSIRSSMSINSIRSFIERKSAGTKSFSDIKVSMKDRRSAFKARLRRTNKKPAPKADVDSSVHTETSMESCNPQDYSATRPKYRYQRSNSKALTAAPVELEAEPVLMKIPATTSSDFSRWTPDSYPDSPITPPADQPIVTTTIRPKEIYTSGEYRHQPTPRRTANVHNLLHIPDKDFDPNPVVLDIGTPGGFKEDFVDTLIAQLEEAGIGRRTISNDIDKGRATARTDQVHDDEGGVWMGMKTGMGMARVNVRTRG